MPWTVRSAQWKYDNNSVRKGQLLEFAAWLGKTHPDWFDVGKFVEEIGQGLYLESNIPEGYGVGSSGSVCAAVVDRFGTEIWTKRPQILKAMFSEVESYFHGTSSGLDPLVIFTGQAIRFKQNKIEAVKLPGGGDGFRFYIVDTGKARKTAPLVRKFKSRIEDFDFRNAVKLQYVSASEQAIDAFLAADPVKLWKPLMRLSVFQYEQMQEMIPLAFRPVWESGIAENDFFMKLCGAGGGGYLLVGVQNDEGYKRFTSLISDKYTELVYSI